MMSLKRIVPLFLFSLLLSLVLIACQGDEPAEGEGDVVPDEVTEVDPDLIAAAPTITPTSESTPRATLPPTNTPLPSGTPAPTLPVRPTSTRQPSPTPPLFIETRVNASTIPAPTSGGTGSVTTTPVAQIPNETNGYSQLLTAANALSQLNTFRVVKGNVINDDTNDEFRLDTTQTCDVRNPSDMYCKNSYELETSSSSQNITSSNEFLKLGNSIWVRANTNDDWDDSNISAVEEDGFTLQSIQTFVIPTFVSSIRSVQNTVLNGVSVYRIEYNINDDIFVDSTIDSSVLNPSDDATVRGVGIAWIGVDDNLPRRSVIDVDVTEDGETVNIAIQTDYSNFNVAITFPNPNN
ncbi:MAG: hypothetical protein KDE51_03005 [Anaerolineales bacterium]|nr:hypothetical protein [Anaerolineales bacterium]